MFLIRQITDLPYLFKGIKGIYKENLFDNNNIYDNKIKYLLDHFTCFFLISNIIRFLETRTG